MKAFIITLVSVLLVGCAGPRRSTSLTIEQATTAAIQAANQQALTLYHCQPFRDGPAARFVQGHWVWVGRQGFGHGDLQATVELAADGSVQQVDLKVLDSRTLMAAP